MEKIRFFRQSCLILNMEGFWDMYFDWTNDAGDDAGDEAKPTKEARNMIA